MQKILATGLIIVFCMLCILPKDVQASTTISAQKATEMAKLICDIPDDIKNFESNYSEYNERGIWNLFWETDSGHISITVDALNGEIIKMYQYENTPEKNSLLPQIDRAQAIKICNEFLKDAIPSKYNQLLKSDSLTSEENLSQEYNINYNRIVNNVPFPQNNVYVRISGHTGKIQSYKLNWDYETKFKPVNGIINQQKAEKILKEKGLELMYYRPYNFKNSQVYLVYSLEQFDRALIDAHSGKYIEAIHFMPLQDRGAMGKGEEIIRELNPIEMEEIELIEGLLPKEDAISIVKKYIDIPNNYQLIRSSLYQDYREKDNRIWSFEWQSLSTEKKGYISATVNAKSGELLSFNKPNYFTDTNNKKAKYNEKQALKIAENFIKEIQPAKFKEIRLNEDRQQLYLKELAIKYPKKEDIKELSFNFIRLVNKIPFYDDGFTVSVDLTNGNITTYSYKWSNIKFPSADKIISTDNAFSSLIEKNPISLNYLYSNYIHDKLTSQEVGLYYHLSKNEPRIINALNGKLLTENGEEYKEITKIQFMDIKGHPAEHDINILRSLGIVSGNNNMFLPNKNITNAEFIKMLVMSIGAYPGEGRKLESLGDEWYSPYYQTAIYRGIITTENLPLPNSELNRIDAAKMLLKALNIDYVAELKDIYIVPAIDTKMISSRDYGYAAISLKLGLLQLKNGKFAPNDIVKRGESATTCVNLMRVNKK